MFTAPETDAAPPGGFTAPADDLDPPSSIGGLAKNAVSNAGRMVFAPGVPVPMAAPVAAKGAAEAIKEGLYDIPKAAAESSVDLLKGTARAITGGGLPSVDDVRESPLIKKTEEMTAPIAKDPAGYAYKNPLDAALLAATPFLALSPAEAETKVPSVETEAPPAEPPPTPSETIPPAPETPAAPEAPAGSAPHQEMPFSEADTAPPGPEPAPAAPAKDPLKDVRDYVNKAVAQKGFPEKMALYLQEEARKAGGRDLGLQGLQTRQMGEGFKGVEKAEQLIDYAREKGYLKPGLTDIGRRQMLESNMKQAGQQVGAIRDLADNRGAPPLKDMFQQLKTQLTEKYGIKAPGEVKQVLAEVQKAMKDDPTFSGVSDISTDLNKELRNVRSMGRHTGPNTDAADILSRMNNDLIRSKLNPQEAKLYTDSLRDFGALKKLEKVVAGAARKGLTGRGAPGSVTNRLMQSLLDRGGYRVAGNVADRVAKTVLKNPGKFKTLPDFFEDLVHQSEDVLDESIEHPGMYQGGVVTPEMAGWIERHR